MMHNQSPFGFLSSAERGFDQEDLDGSCDETFFQDAVNEDEDMGTPAEARDVGSIRVPHVSLPVFTEESTFRHLQKIIEDEATKDLSWRQERYGQSRIAEQVGESVFAMVRNREQSKPWENLALKNCFSRPRSSDMFQVPMLGRFDSSGMLNQEESIRAANDAWVGAYPFASKRLLASKMALSDDALRANALKKIRNIVLFHPEDSQLGRALLTKAGALVGEDELQRSLHDAIAGKATGTVVKRASDFNRWATWQVTQNHRRPLSPCENDIYKYLGVLKDQGAAATVGTSFLKAWNFFRYVFGADGHGASAVISGRVRGVAQSMFSRKRRLQQAPPIPADFVYRLEKFVCSQASPFLRTIAGSCLFCIYSCSRFGEAAKGDGQTLDFQHFKHFFLVEATLDDYKTANFESRAVGLPLIALGSGLFEKPWAIAWQQAREQSGANLSKFIQPADHQANEVWLQRRMTTAEGSWWVKDLLVMVGMSVDQAAEYSTHSLKTTCLSWAAKSGNMSVTERLWLGHHQNSESKMAVVYARDALATVLTKLHRIIEAIQRGLFDPDLPRVQRIAMATGWDERRIREPPKSEAEVHLDEVLEEEEKQLALDSDQSDVDNEAAVLEAPVELHADRRHERPSFPDLDLACCRQHRISRIVHLISSPQRFACGRNISVNMLELDSNTDKSTLDFCEQCHAHL